MFKNVWELILSFFLASLGEMWTKFRNFWKKKLRFYRSFIHLYVLLTTPLLVFLTNVSWKMLRGQRNDYSTSRNFLLFRDKVKPTIKKISIPRCFVDFPVEKRDRCLTQQTRVVIRVFTSIRTQQYGPWTIFQVRIYHPSYYHLARVQFPNGSFMFTREKGMPLLFESLVVRLLNTNGWNAR